MLRVFDFGTHQHAPCIGIDCGADGGHARIENTARKGVDPDVLRLSDTKSRAVGLGNVRQHPHRIDIGDRIGSGRAAGLHQQSRRRIAGDDSAGDRAGDDEGRIGDAFSDDIVDIGIGLAEDAHRVARRSQIAFGRLLVGGGLLHVVLGNRPRRIEIAKTSQIACRQIQHAGRSDQGRFSLQQIGTVDGEKGLALFDVVAHFGEQRDDLALVRRKDLHRHVFIEIDAADRLFFHGKLTFLDRRDFHEFELRIGQFEGVRILCRGTRAGCLGLRPAASRIPTATPKTRWPRQRGPPQRPPL